MEYIQFDAKTWLSLVDSSDSKTWKILKYLLEKAVQSNNNIQVTYKTVEDDLHIGHTTVGKNMRLFLTLKVLERIESGTYRFNKQIFQMLKTEECF